MTDSSRGPSRRTVLRALGAGGALSALGGVTVVGARDDANAQRTDANTGVASQQSGTGTVHRIQTVISGPPTNPERPADFFYQPTGIRVQPGDVLAFEFVTPDHNVVPYHPAFGMRRRVPVGVEAFSSPLLGFRPSSIPGDQIEPPAPPSGEGGAGGPVPDQFLLALGTPGVYDLLCSPHEHFGMAMRVVVGDVTETEFETDDASALPEPRAGPVELARETLTDPALAPAAIAEQGRVQWQSLAANQPDGGGEGGDTGGDGGGPGGDGDSGAA